MNGTVAVHYSPPHPHYWDGGWMLTSLEVHLLRYASSFVIAAYFYVRLIPQPACCRQAFARLVSGTFYCAVSFDDFLP